MKTQANRAKRLEQKVPAKGRQFIGWPHNPWTPEQEAEAIRRRPRKRLFWRSLVETPEDTRRKMADPSEEV
jgi:hypothetical protein